jgi:hypothetical protein
MLAKEIELEDGTIRQLPECCYYAILQEIDATPDTEKNRQTLAKLRKKLLPFSCPVYRSHASAIVIKQLVAWCSFHQQYGQFAVRT